MKSSNSLSFRSEPTRIWKVVGFILCSFCFTLLLSCSDDEDDINFSLDGDTLSIADIAGNWTSVFIGFQDLDVPDNEAQNVDYSALGATATLNIANDGRFTGSFSLPQGSTVNFSGQMGFSGDRLLLLEDSDGPGDEVLWNITLTEEDILSLAGDLEIDFDEDGTIDPTIVSLQMER
ncbi:MAG: hypothetical protein AAF554_09090 [Bacteroidota bacterium]